MKTAALKYQYKSKSSHLLHNSWGFKFPKFADNKPIPLAPQKLVQLPCLCYWWQYTSRVASSNIESISSSVQNP